MNEKTYTLILLWINCICGFFFLTKKSLSWEEQDKLGINKNEEIKRSKKGRKTISNTIGSKKKKKKTEVKMKKTRKESMRGKIFTNF